MEHPVIFGMNIEYLKFLHSVRSLITKLFDFQLIRVFVSPHSNEYYVVSVKYEILNVISFRSQNIRKKIYHNDERTWGRRVTRFKIYFLGWKAFYKNGIAVSKNRNQLLFLNKKRIFLLNAEEIRFFPHCYRKFISVERVSLLCLDFVTLRFLLWILLASVNQQCPKPLIRLEKLGLWTIDQSLGQPK